MQIDEYPLVLLVTDYRGLIPQRIMAWDGYNLRIIKEVLEHSGIQVQVVGAHELRFDKLQERNKVAAIYASSQEPRYKQYLQDVIANLYFSGVRLYPELEHMMAHEDKAYQAIRLTRTDIGAPRSFVFGDKWQALEFVRNSAYPIVGKSPDGSGSKGVYLLNNKQDANRFVKGSMVHRSYKKGRPLIMRAIQRALKPSPSLGLLIFQEFIPNLKGDWKILIWGNAACGAFREIRPKDFRASGSGRIQYIDVPEAVLEYAYQACVKLRLNWGSLDIGFDGSQCYLFEYQGIHFGLTVAEKSLFFYRRVNGYWNKQVGQIQIEEQMGQIIINDFVEQGWIEKKQR
jgi:glutathione synthase/RimK-type ligase-like ATP-grasp enzyme